MHGGVATLPRLFFGEITMTLLLSEEQHNAVDLGLDRKKKLVGVTGAAGTGKTTITKEVFEGDWKMPVLVAPTGRAAKRIQEATGKPAMTIHRMMRYSMPADDDEAGLPAYDKWNKLPYDCIIVDESSMVSDDIYRAVIDAMPAGACIRFFGDANQLPPVKSESPFLSILDKWPNIRLTKNFRSDDGIIRAATQIINGRVPEPNDKFRMLNPGAGNHLDALDEFIDDSFRGLGGQIIIPNKGGKYGTIGMNKYLQQRLNHTGPVIEIHRKDKDGNIEVSKFRRGDKVIWTKNDYNLNLFNGQIGWVVDFHDDALVVNFDDKDKVIPPHLESYDPNGRAIFQYDPRVNLDLAYAITTHKAQGSEFNKVVYFIQKSYVLDRANFYTAVTRAKEQVTVLFGSGALQQAIKKRTG